METEKKYLNTIEEVSDALAEGKVVYDKEEKKCWIDKNGFIVTENGMGEKFLNDYMWATKEHGYYILEPKPLEVKLWHLYENKNGEKVLIWEKFPSKNLLGVNFSTKDTVLFASNGTCLNEWSCDLVKELADLSKYFEKEDDNAKND